MELNNAEQNAIWFAYLDIKGLLEAEDDFALAQLQKGAEVSLRELETQFPFLLEEAA